MRRVMYVFLPSWPIDRLRQAGKKPDRSLPSLCDGPVEGEKPFATVVEVAGRRLIAAVNLAAAAAGLAPGMPLADALSFLPGLATAPAEPAADLAALTRLAEWCGRYSPWTAPDGTDGLKIEITGCAHLWGGEAALVADLAQRLGRRGILCRIAVAGTLGAAWALARFTAQDGRPSLPAPESEPASLASLPVEALRLDPATVAGLRRVGLRRVGELYPMPRDALARRFGDVAAHRLDQAFGAVPEPLSPLREAPVRRVRLSFAEPIADPADFVRAIERLTHDLTARLGREGMGARRLDLAFHRVDGRVEHIRIGTARPSRDPRHLAGLLTAKLETVDPGLGVEDMILALFAAEKLPPEQAAMRPLSLLFNTPLPPHAGGEGRVRGVVAANSESAPLIPPSPPTGGRGNFRGAGTGSGYAASEGWYGLAPLLDRLGVRLGLDAIVRIEARESHVPEHASVYVPVNESPHPNPPPRAGVGVHRGSGDKLPRPVRLFSPPEPIEAMFVVPDDPPFRFTWRRRSHAVARADGPERVAEEWWTADASGDVDALRDYYRVEDEEGRRFWLFRAGFAQDPRWFVHGIFA
jgi:protein ImuB